MLVQQPTDSMIQSPGSKQGIISPVFLSSTVRFDSRTGKRGSTVKCAQEFKETSSTFLLVYGFEEENANPARKHEFRINLCEGA